MTIENSIIIHPVLSILKANISQSLIPNRNPSSLIIKRCSYEIFFSVTFCMSKSHTLLCRTQNEESRSSKGTKEKASFFLLDK